MTSQTQQTQQTQEGHEYSMYDQSFDVSSTFARFVSTTNTDRFETVMLPRREPGQAYTFGRHKSCDFILPGNRFSNIHFKVWEQETEGSKYGDYCSVVLVEDLSTNGTFLNQARIGKGQRTVLANGDELAAGIGVATDEVRYLIQLPQQSRPTVTQGMTAEASACMQKYEIRQILGAGAFATVRIALERATGTKFAVKILNQRKLAITGSGTKATELFKREIEILQSTKHPHVVQYVDMWADDTEIYLVLEYLPGGDLMDYIMRRKRLSELETVKIIEQVLDALVYCHKIGIAHRDIKPENILLTKDDPPIAKLTDFGLAKMVEPGSFLKTFCGTLTYVAPEVISMHGRIAGAYSTAVDMWSVGCVAFIMLAGSMPFIADSQDAMMHTIQQGDYDDGALEDIELSGAGMDFVESLLRVNPAQRMTGEQALMHPWITNIDHDSMIERKASVDHQHRGCDDGNGESAMDHDSQSEVCQLQVHPNSSASAFPYDNDRATRNTGRLNGNGLFDESVNWSTANHAHGAHLTRSEIESFDNRLSNNRDPGWNVEESHFSQESSTGYIGSSKYVSASSQLAVTDSNATITPQRLKQARQGVIPNAAWFDKPAGDRVERQYMSEPVIRH